MRGRISEVEPWITLGIENFEVNDSITLVACGTSFYAAMIGKYLIEEIANIPVFVELASEYRYFGGKGSKTVIAITQSGETADTLAAIKKAKKYGYKTMAITNCIGSTAARLADEVILTQSGPEIGVAATKTFTSQIIILLLLAHNMGVAKKKVAADVMQEQISYLKMLPSIITRILEKSDDIKEIASRIMNAQTVFFIGRGINYPLALEGALKLKEISYIHAEGFAAGELKHGPFALLTKETPVVAIVTKDKTYEKTLSNIGEIKARNSPVIAIVEEEDEESEQYADFTLRFPSVPFSLSPIPIAVILQLLAYHVAHYRDCSIDKPRNLAKSVTVE
jgi:glucosamine--fructose-6-phosphate aminotransferase (isomerizing)